MKMVSIFLGFFSVCLAAEGAGILAGPVTNAANGNVYYLLTADNWTNSQTAAVQLGGNLATINDAAEDAWVYSTFASFGGIPRTMWIGLNDAQTEGAFVWVSGEASPYTHWGPGEPNNIGNEDFVCYFPPNYQYHDTWNDCGWSQQCNGVVEIARVNMTNCVPVPPGMISWWTGDGNGNDLAGTNHGTPVGGLTYASGLYGQAFNFDGSDDGLNVPDSPSLQLTQSMTMEGWIYIRAYPYEPQNFWGNAAIVFRGDDRPGLDPYYIMVKSTQRLEFAIQSPQQEQIVLDAPIAAARWIHVAATLDDATGAMKLYINGVLVAETVTTRRALGPLDPASNSGLGIGNVQGAGRSPFRFPFNGFVDNMRFYSRALSQAEIQGIYNPVACEVALDLNMYAGLTIFGQPGRSVRIDYRDVLSGSDDWRTLTNIALPTSPYLFFDLESSHRPKRFYRAFMAP